MANLELQCPFLVRGMTRNFQTHTEKHSSGDRNAWSQSLSISEIAVFRVLGAGCWECLHPHQGAEENCESVLPDLVGKERPATSTSLVPVVSGRDDHGADGFKQQKLASLPHRGQKFKGTIRSRVSWGELGVCFFPCQVAVPPSWGHCLSLTYIIGLGSLC